MAPENVAVQNGGVKCSLISLEHQPVHVPATQTLLYGTCHVIPCSIMLFVVAHQRHGIESYYYKMDVTIVG